MNATRLKTAVDLLREARSKMRDDVDARVIQHLDKAIEALEAEVRSAEGRTANKMAALRAVGEALKWIPAVRGLIEELLK